MLWVWLIVTVCLLAFPLILKGVLLYVVAPIRIHGKQTLPIRPDYKETRLEDLTPEMREYLSEILGEFITEGFEVGVNVHHPNASNNMSSWQVLLVNRARGETATVIIVFGRQRRAFSQVVRTQFGDGKSIVSAVSQSPRIFPPDPMVDSRNFPWVKSPAALVEVHRRRVAASGRGAETPVVPQAGEEIRYMLEEREREVRRFVECGYKWMDEAAGVCRFTWKGAILTTWKLADPVKQIRFYLRTREGLRDWKALGMDQWKPTAAVGQQPAAAQALPLPPRNHEPLPLPQPLPHRGGAVGVGGDLSYEASLHTGELRTHWSDGALTVRLGGYSAGQMLGRQWRTILSIAFWCLLAAVMGFNWWLFQRRFPFRPPGSRLPRFELYILVIGFFLLMDVVRLIRAVRRARGTMVVVASRSGIRFSNAPAAVGEGEIPRSDVEVIHVLQHEGIFRRRYRLDVRRRGAMRAQTILVGPDKKLLEEAARAMRQAMGIESPGQVATPISVS